MEIQSFKCDLAILLKCMDNTHFLFTSTSMSWTASFLCDCLELNWVWFCHILQGKLK